MTYKERIDEMVLIYNKFVPSISKDETEYIANLARFREYTHSHDNRIIIHHMLIDCKAGYVMLQVDILYKTSEENGVEAAYKRFYEEAMILAIGMGFNANRELQEKLKQ